MLHGQVDKWILNTDWMMLNLRMRLYFRTSSVLQLVEIRTINKTIACTKILNEYSNSQIKVLIIKRFPRWTLGRGTTEDEVSACTRTLSTAASMQSTINKCHQKWCRFKNNKRPVKTTPWRYLKKNTGLFYLANKTPSPHVNCQP